MEFLRSLAATAFSTALDVAPIVAILVVFQIAVLRRKPPNLRRIVAASFLVLRGSPFLIGLERGAPSRSRDHGPPVSPRDHRAASLADGVRGTTTCSCTPFARPIGFSTTVATPSSCGRLKAEEVSGGAVGVGMRSRRGARRAAAFPRLASGSSPARVPLVIIRRLVVGLVQTFRSSPTSSARLRQRGGDHLTSPYGWSPRSVWLAAPVPRSPLIDGSGHRFRQRLPISRFRATDGRVLGEPPAPYDSTSPSHGLIVDCALVSDEKTDIVIDAARAGRSDGARYHQRAREGCTERPSSAGAGHKRDLVLFRGRAPSAPTSWSASATPGRSMRARRRNRFPDPTRGCGGLSRSYPPSWKS